MARLVSAHERVNPLNSSTTSTPRLRLMLAHPDRTFWSGEPGRSSSPVSDAMPNLPQLSIDRIGDQYITSWMLFTSHSTGTRSSRRRLFKKVFADLLHSYCSGRNRFIHAFARPEIFYYSAITVASSFALNCIKNVFLNAQNWTFFDTAHNYVVNSTF